MIEWVSMVGWGWDVLWLLVCVGVLGILAFGVLRLLRRVAEQAGSEKDSLERRCRVRDEVLAFIEALPQSVTPKEKQPNHG